MHVAADARRRHGFTLLLTIAIAGCGAGGERRASTLPPDSTPAARVTDAPPGTLSRFDVPLEFDFSTVLDLVERVIPQSFGSLDSIRQVGDNDKKHYAFAATRGRFTAFARGTEVYMRTVFSYAARGYYKPPIGPTLSAGCGTGNTQPAIVVELATPLTLSPDWHLKSTARISQLSAASDSLVDRCRVSFLGFDVTPKVIDAARQAISAHLRDIDQKVAGIDLTEKATGWWTTVNRPIKLADEVWLLLSPAQFRLGSVRGERHVLTIDAGLDAFPRIVMGREPVPKVAPLPPLAADTITNGFRVQVEGSVNYVSASRTFDAELRGKTFSQGGRSVTIRSVTASHEPPNRVALTVSFTGDATGALRFVGTPGFDVAHENIVVADLDYDLTTDSQVINAYSWLRSDALLLLFRKSARVPLAPVLERGKSLVLKGINRTIKDVVTLSGTVDSVAVLDVLVTSRGLVVRASANGNARVAVKPKR
jgi:hypothetical protein